MRKFPYREGTWFAVPLRDRGYAVGLVARKDPRGGILGYFFGPRRQSIPRMADVENLRADGAVLVARAGDLGLVEGTWPRIGDMLPWKREEWPLPAFGEAEFFTGRARRVRYSDDNLLRPSSVEAASPSEAEGLASGDLYGAGAVEIELTKLLSEARLGKGAES